LPTRGPPASSLHSSFLRFLFGRAPISIQEDGIRFLFGRTSSVLVRWLGWVRDVGPPFSIQEGLQRFVSGARLGAARRRLTARPAR
jgi:hypothetical protein